MHSRALRTQRDFLPAEPKSCWKQFKSFPFGLPLCGKRGELFATALAGSFHRSLGSKGHFIHWLTWEPGRAWESRRWRGRGHWVTLAFPSLVTISEGARRALGPGFNPALASHFPLLSLIPLSLPCDLLSSQATFSPWSAQPTRGRPRVIQLSSAASCCDLFLHLLQTWRKERRRSSLLAAKPAFLSWQKDTKRQNIFFHPRQ